MQPCHLRRMVEQLLIHNLAEFTPRTSKADERGDIAVSGVEVEDV